MSEEERDILVTKRKYWIKLMKYNLTFTVFFGIGLILLAVTIADSCDGKASEVGLGCNLIFFPALISWLWIFVSWPLMILMYAYQRFKIYKITKPKVLAKSSEMGLRSAHGRNTGDHALLLHIAMAIGLILIFAGGFSQANVSMAIEGCGEMPMYVDIEDYSDCIDDAQTKAENAIRLSALGFVISLLVIYIRISGKDEK